MITISITTTKKKNPSDYDYNFDYKIDSVFEYDYVITTITDLCGRPMAAMAYHVGNIATQLREFLANLQPMEEFENADEFNNDDIEEGHEFD